MTPYLYAHQNPHAPRRANGLRFYGYPGRSSPIRLIGLHTTESVFDEAGEDLGAEQVARFQSETKRPSSYHRIVDRDSTVVCLPDDATAFGIVGLNSPTLQLSLAMRAADWSDPRKAALARPTLERAATVAADWCARHDIPVRWLTKAQAEGGERGFIRHGVADPGRRSDPGRDFPADLFLDLIRGQLAAPSTVQEDTVRLVYGSTSKQYLTDMLTTKRHVESIETSKALQADGVPLVGGAEYDGVLAGLPEGPAIP